MYKHVDDYLTELKTALIGCDQATIQDALADAEDHLRTALAGTLGKEEAEALTSIIDAYGSPEEVAAAYRDIERRIPPVLAPAANPKERTIWERFFGVIGDPRAWGALLYMLISLLTGILYFTWAVTGLSLSVGLLILIIGIPFLMLFLLSVRGISLVEGRIVEALLGVRMPRRSIFFDKNKSWGARIKDVIFSWGAWKTILYMVLMLPLGVLYFSVFITLITLGISFIAAPIVQLFIHYPMVTWGLTHYYISTWQLPIWFLAGALILLVSMHFAKLIGRLQGAFAKLMLVSE